MINDELTKECIAILREDYNQEVTAEEAREYLRQWTSFFDHIADMQDQADQILPREGGDKNG